MFTTKQATELLRLMPDIPRSVDLTRHARFLMDKRGKFRCSAFMSVSTAERLGISADLQSAFAVLGNETARDKPAGGGVLNLVFDNGLCASLTRDGALKVMAPVLILQRTA